MRVYELLIGRRIKLNGEIYTIQSRQEWFSQGYSAGFIYKLVGKNTITADIGVIETAELY